MDIQVETGKARLLIDAASQTAYLLPATVTWTDGEVSGRMTVDGQGGRPIAHNLELRGPAGSFDAVEYVRTELRHVIREARAKLEVPLQVEDDGRMTVQTDVALMGKQSGGKRIWRRLTPEFLEAVARTYMDAKEAGDPPALAVMREWDAPRNTVNDWLRAARDQGFLPPAR